MSQTWTLVRNVGTRVWIWPWGEDGPERVEPGDEIWIGFTPSLKRQPGESGEAFLDRVDARCQAGDERIRLVDALWRAGMLRSVPPPPITQH
jgi:hypothetical protein